MNDELSEKNRILTDKLANFTDQALSGKQPVENLLEDDPELAKLARTVLQIQSVIEQDAPETAMSRRIKTQLTKVWQDQQQSSNRPMNPEKDPPRFRQSIGPALRFTSVVAVVTLLVVVLFSDSLQDLPATAGRNPGLVFGTFIGMALLVVVILVITNRK